MAKGTRWPEILNIVRGIVTNPKVFKFLCVRIVWAISVGTGS